MAEIVPAITPHSFKELREKLELVSHHVRLVHIDVTNGTLTPGKMWPYSNNEGFEEIVGEREGLPHWEDLNFEVHLMVENPENMLGDWISAGIQSAIVHIEALSMSVEEMKEKFYGIEIGLGVNLETPLEKYAAHLLKADFIHLMSIAEIGDAGQPFDRRIFDKISELKSEHPHLQVSVDGGVSLTNAEELLEAGADRLVVNSAIFKSDEPEDALDDLIEIAHDFNR
jgi:ribulose-phosphate 3-epimerase